jgi:hypothetical protein
MKANLSKQIESRSFNRFVREVAVLTVSIGMVACQPRSAVVDSVSVMPSAQLAVRTFEPTNVKFTSTTAFFWRSDVNGAQVAEVLRAANAMDDVTEEQALIKIRQDELIVQFRDQSLDLEELASRNLKLADSESQLTQAQSDLSAESSKPESSQDPEKVRLLNSTVRRLQRWLNSNREAVLAERARVSELGLDAPWEEFRSKQRRLAEIEAENIRLPRVIEERTEFVKFSPSAVYLRFDGAANLPWVQFGEALQSDPNDAARYLPNTSGIDFFGDGRSSYSNRNVGPGLHPVHQATYEPRGGVLEFDLFSADAWDTQGRLLPPRRLHVKIVRTKYTAADGKIRFQGDLILYDLQGKLLKRGVLKLEGRAETPAPASTPAPETGVTQG